MSQPLIQRILFPTDFSSCAEGAYRHAAYLADRLGAELHVLHVVEHEGDPELAWPEAPGTGHLRITMSDICEDLGLPVPSEDEDYDPFDLVEVVETEVVGSSAAGAILDYVQDEEVDLVVMGTHGRTGWRRGVLGSVAENVARRAPCPVLTVRPLEAGAGPWPPRRVLAAVDVEALIDGEIPAPALWAARLAAAYQAPLDLLYVVAPPRLSLDGPPAAALARKSARQKLIGLSYTIHEAIGRPILIHALVRSGEPAETIVTVAAEAPAHLVAVGTQGRQGAGRALFGSVAEAVVRSADCPVLVARDDLAEADPGAQGEASAGIGRGVAP